MQHEVVIALAPEFFAMGNGIWHSIADRLERVLAERFRIQWRQFAMPVDSLGLSLHGCPPFCSRRLRRLAQTLV
jgi:hypothetical protein